MTTGYFGSADQQAMSRRGEALFRMVHHDPRYSWYGRNVALADFEQGGVDVLADLTRIQGAAVSYRVPRDKIASVCEALEAKGLRSDWMGFCYSEDSGSPDRARALLNDVLLPSDVTVTRLAADSGDVDVTDLGEVALESGVLPPPASVLRGEARQGVVLLARDAEGRAIACAAAIETFHPEGTMGDHGWWGMLATRPERRGEKIALHLGARAMATMSEEAGLTRFVTGIRDDNAASLKLCAQLGVRPSPYVIAMAMDPSAFSDTRITK